MPVGSLVSIFDSRERGPHERNAEKRPFELIGGNGGEDSVSMLVLDHYSFWEARGVISSACGSLPSFLRFATRK